MSKILMTGSTGFIGSRLVKFLKEEKHDVYEIVRYISGGRYDYYERENRFFADIRDREAVRGAVMKCRPDIILNLAAQTAVSFSFINPIDVQETNFVSVANLAEIAREVGVKHFIHASTSEVYGKSKNFPITEEDNLGATSPYAVAKIAAENYLKLMYEIHDFPVTILRPFNSYGRALGGVNNRHYVVERAITQAITEGHIHLHNPEPQRDFLFRDDHCRGYIQAIKNREKVIGEALNLSTSICWSIGDMAKEIATIVGLEMGKSVEVSFDEQPDRPKDIDVLHGDGSKSKALMDWAPKYSFTGGLRLAVEEWMTALGVVEP